MLASITPLVSERPSSHIPHLLRHDVRRTYHGIFMVDLESETRLPLQYLWYQVSIPLRILEIKVGDALALRLLKIIPMEWRPRMP